MADEALCLEERVAIEVGVAAGLSARAIARGLGRAPSTVTRELSAGGGAAGYRAVHAQARADRLRCRPTLTKLASDPVLADHVRVRLLAKDSPMTISVELAHGVYPDVAARVSHETLYQAVQHPGRYGLPAGIHKCLHRRRKCRKRRLPKGEIVAVKGPLGEFNLIHARPPAAAQRSEAGHIEGDLITGSFNRSAIVTLVDRLSRKTWLADLPTGHGADQVLAALVELVERIPVFATLTWDRGREMACHPDFTELTGIGVYFADPHSPWQRPSNEHGNGILRRYVGKGTNLNIHTPADLQRIEDRINTMPRRIHHWHHANHVYAHAVALTA